MFVLNILTQIYYCAYSEIMKYCSSTKSTTSSSRRKKENRTQKNTLNSLVVVAFSHWARMGRIGTNKENKSQKRVNMRKKRWVREGGWEESVKSQTFKRIHSWYFVAYFFLLFLDIQPLSPPSPLLLLKYIKWMPLKWVYTREKKRAREERERNMLHIQKVNWICKREFHYTYINFYTMIYTAWF